MALLPIAAMAGTLLVGLTATILTGEIGVLVIVLAIVAIYALVDRRLRTGAAGDDRLRPVSPPPRED